MKTNSMQKDSTLLEMLPKDLSGLSADGDKVYTTDNELYDYINGGAELYLNYGFQSLAQRTYKLGDNNEIKAEIFDLSEPKNAFGVFSYSRSEKNVEIGQGGQYVGGSLIFWQDCYFVSIFSKSETEKSKKVVLQLGEQISQSIGKKGTLPTVFQIIPHKGLEEGSTFYFHHPAWQNKYHFISLDNIFNLDKNTMAILNKYDTDEKRFYLLLIQYTEKRKAMKALKKAALSISSELQKKRIVQDENGNWTGCEQVDELLIFVFDAPSKGEAMYLLDQAAGNFSQLK